MLTLTLAEAAHFDDVGAPFIAPAPALVPAFVVVDPVTVGVLTFLDARRILLGEQFGERYSDLGFWLINRMPPSPRIAAWMRNIPGAVLVSLIASTALSSSVAETLAVLVTVLVAIRTKQVLVAMILGVIAVWALRHII